MILLVNLFRFDLTEKVLCHPKRNRKNKNGERCFYLDAVLTKRMCWTALRSPLKAFWLHSWSNYGLTQVGESR